MSFLLVSALLASQALPQVQETPTPTPTPLPASAVEVADARFDLRAVGAIEDVADPAEVDAAIELFRNAVAASPEDMEILGKLIRALHFRGAHTGASLEEKKRIFDEGRMLGQSAVDRIEKDARKAPGMTRIEALRKINGLPLLYLWTAAHWGESALMRGKFAAAKSGIAGKVRDLAQAVVDVDPAFEDAAGYRVLGRLHSEAPKIPLVTGWVSHDKGLKLLRQAYEVNPNLPMNLFFLGEAILDHDPEKTEEARRLLEQCATETPRPRALVEDIYYAHLARKRLDVVKQAN